MLKNLMRLKKRFQKTISAVISKFRIKKISNYEIYFTNLISKNGLEIGGPSGIFEKDGVLPIYPIVANLDGCNFSSTTTWEGKIEEGMSYKYHENKNGYQFICDAVDLGVIKSKSYNFVIASHVIEHIANPFKAILEWLRILKDEGILLLIVPHKDETFDHKRPVTPLKHLIEDFKKNIKEDVLSHLAEILELLDINDPDLGFIAGALKSFKKRSMKNFENRCLHHHVFNTKLVLELLNHFKLQILCVDVVIPYHIIVMAKKMQNKKIINNNLFLSKKAEYRRRSPFESDL